MDRRVGAPSTVAVAIAGALVVHSLAYLIAHPDPSLRAAALEGHGYLEAATLLVVPVATLALLWLAVGSLRRSGARLGVWSLVALQSMVFAAQELIERIPTGDVGEVMHEPAIAIGFMLQIPVALLIVGLVGLGRRVVESVPAVLYTPRRHYPPVFSACVASAAAVFVAPVALPRSRRGPPALLDA